MVPLDHGEAAGGAGVAVLKDNQPKWSVVELPVILAFLAMLITAPILVRACARTVLIDPSAQTF